VTDWLNARSCEYRLLLSQIKVLINSDEYYYKPDMIYRLWSLKMFQVSFMCIHYLRYRWLPYSTIDVFLSYYN